MGTIKLFDSIEKDDVKKMLTCFDAKKLHFKKEAMILSNLANKNRHNRIWFCYYYSL